VAEGSLRKQRAKIETSSNAKAQSSKKPKAQILKYDPLTPALSLEGRGKGEGELSNVNISWRLLND
jgi:hypothetical protein